MLEDLRDNTAAARYLSFSWDDVQTAAKTEGEGAEEPDAEDAESNLPQVSQGTGSNGSSVPRRRKAQEMLEDTDSEVSNAESNGGPDASLVSGVPTAPA